jgi:hypothetical protein
VGTGFVKKDMRKQKIERDDDSRKSHPALARACGRSRRHHRGGGVLSVLPEAGRGFGKTATWALRQRMRMAQAEEKGVPEAAE